MTPGWGGSQAFLRGQRVREEVRMAGVPVGTAGTPQSRPLARRSQDALRAPWLVRLLAGAGWGFCGGAGGPAHHSSPHLSFSTSDRSALTFELLL